MFIYQRVNGGFHKKKQMGIEPDQQRYEDSMPSVPLSWVKNQDSPTEFVYIVIVPNSYILGFNGIFMGIQYNTMGISGINMDPALPTCVFDKINMIGT